jgi:ferredoxin
LAAVGAGLGQSIRQLASSRKIGLHPQPAAGIHKATPTHLITMADREDKNSENVAGKFYVDSQCIDCDLCRETAPNNFTRAEDEGYSYVFKQPENDEETAQCREAMEGCPVEAIGDDGDE